MVEENDDRADALIYPEDYFNESDVTNDECDELSTDIPDTAPCSIDREARMLTMVPDVVEE